MTTATKSRKANELHFIARATFKATGAVLYGIQSGENVYHITVIAGHVKGCCNANGEDCKGFHFQGHCKHTDYVAQLEAARTDEQAAGSAHDMIDAPAAGSLTEWVERVTEEASWDDRRRAFEAIKKEIAHIEMRHEMGLVAELLPEMAATGDVEAHVKDSIASGELDWIDAERAAWEAATPEQKREWLCTEFDLSYGDEAA